MVVEYLRSASSGKRKPFSKNSSTILAESTKIENASFPYKTAISEANIKTNSEDKMDPIEQNSASKYFIFLKILFRFKNLL